MEYEDDRTVMRSHSQMPRQPPPAALEVDDDVNVLPVGTRLHEFEITGVIGKGGFGIVYLAYDHALDIHVAVKEYMPFGYASRRQTMHVTVTTRQYVDTFTAGLKSFLNEARLLARFDSPSLVKVKRYWEQNGTAYMVMPFYDGKTLKATIKEKGVLPDEPWIVALVKHLLDALETLHQAECYHRDIAPDNILLLADGRPLLLDFGAARRIIGDVTQASAAFLKPGFAPIEQYGQLPGLHQGPWTDIYALGGVMYYLVSGKVPPDALARCFRDELLPAAEIGKGKFSAALLSAIDHALAVRPENRIQSVDELRDALGIETRKVAQPAAPPQYASAATRPADSDDMRTEVRREPTLAFGPQTARRTQPGRTQPGRAQTVDRTEARDSTRNAAPPAPAPAYVPRERRGWLRHALYGVAALALAGIGFAGYWWLDSASSGKTTTATGNVPERVLPPAVSAAPEVSVSPPVTKVEPPAQLETPPLASIEPTPNRNTTPPAQVVPPPSVLPSREQAPAAATPKPREQTERKNAAVTPVLPVPPAAPAKANTPEDRMWADAYKRDTPQAYAAYRKKYPKGKYEAEARSRLDNLNRLAAAQTPSKPEKKAGAPAPESSGASSEPTSSGDSSPARETAANGKDTGAANGAPIAGNSSSGASQLDKPAQKTTPPADMPPLAMLPSTRDTSAKPADSDSAKISKPKIDPPPQKSPAPEPQPDQPVIKTQGATTIGSFASDPSGGTMSGTGQIKWSNGDAFYGTLVKGSKEGKGMFVWANGQQYEGEWLNDQPNGTGKLFYANGNRYQGDVRNGEPHGKGATWFTNGDIYTGTWARGKRDGKGLFVWASGQQYNGDWVADKATGKGEILYTNGDRYTGAVRDGEPEGHGTMHFQGGDVYAGDWHRGARHGHGRYTWANGTYWEGEFKDGKQTENGKLVFAAG